MDRRFSAHPLDVSRPAILSPCHCLAEDTPRENLTAAGIKSGRFGNAKDAPQVAAGKVEQMRRHNLRLLAIFDSVPEEARRIAGLARTALARVPIHSAAMLT